jgi:hypothetical protein
VDYQYHDEAPAYIHNPIARIVAKQFALLGKLVEYLVERDEGRIEIEGSDGLIMEDSDISEMLYCNYLKQYEHVDYQYHDEAPAYIHNLIARIVAKQFASLILSLILILARVILS